MIGDLRTRRVVRVLALAMQLCMAWMSISALVHSEDDDVLCNPVVVVHDHNAHHIGAAGSTSGPAPEHCFICHNLSLRSLVATASIATPAVVEQPFAQRSIVAAGVTLVARRQARAPPLA
ncbi:MAG: hypothetical protein QM736_12145 [Vicinamibacterales bacterium]